MIALLYLLARFVLCLVAIVAFAWMLSRLIYPKRAEWEELRDPPRRLK